MSPSTGPSVRPTARSSAGPTTGSSAVPVAGSSAVPLGRRALALAGHYVEMVAAMVVGMVALGPVWHVAWPGYADRVETMSLVMAFDMTVAMAGWMAVRRHDRRSIAVMSAAMVAPFGAMLVPYEAGLVSADAVMVWGHVLMLVAMAAAMAVPGGGHRHHGHH